MFNLIEKTRERQRTAREDAYATPLCKFHPGNPELFRADTLWPYFERLRQEEPVHFCSTSPVGKYWSVTKYSDIMYVDSNAAIFSSDLSLTLAVLGSACERVLHAVPDVLRNFDTVSARPGHERNLMRPYFAAYCGDGVAEGRSELWIPCRSSNVEFPGLGEIVRK